MEIKNIYLFNKEKIIKIRTNGYYKSDRYRYKAKPKKYFWQKKQGVYRECGFGSNVYYGLEIPKNHTLINGIIYENPEVVLYFEEDHSLTLSYDTKEEAIEKAKLLKVEYGLTEVTK